MEIVMIPNKKCSHCSVRDKRKTQSYLSVIQVKTRDHQLPPPGAGPPPPTPEPTFVIKSLTLIPSNAFAKSPGQ